MIKAVLPAKMQVNVMVCFSPLNIDANVCSFESYCISMNLLFNLHVIQKGNKRIRQLLMIRPNINNGH